MNAQPIRREAREINQACYTCEECNTLSLTPGPCEICGEERTGKHLMSVEDGLALVCACGEACSCTSISEEDPTRCTCGEAVLEVSLEGKFICDCGPSCPDCSRIAEEPGACECGKSRRRME